MDVQYKHACMYITARYEEIYSSIVYACNVGLCSYELTISATRGSACTLLNHH